MSKRISVRLLLVIVAALAALPTIAACGGDEPAKTNVRTVNEADTKQLDSLHSQDPSLKRLKDLGYMPVTVWAVGGSRVVSYRLCHGMWLEDCANTVEPTTAEPVIYLFTTTVGFNDPITFSGESRVVYTKPEKLTPALNISATEYKLYCKPVPPADADTLSPTPKAAMRIEDIDAANGRVGTYFSGLEYSKEDGKAMTHSTRDNSGAGWDCTAHHQFM